MNVNLINPFVASCCEVLTTMAKLSPRIGRPTLQERVPRGYPLYAAIEITGATVGTVAFGFPAEIAAALTSALLGGDRRAIDADCLDAMGEVANMIAGSAKQNLPGGLCGISTPRVSLDRRGLPPARPPVVVIPCFCGDHQFDIEVSLRPATVAAAA
jgi:chemotaxis protein CheX